MQYCCIYIMQKLDLHALGKERIGCTSRPTKSTCPGLLDMTFFACMLITFCLVPVHFSWLLEHINLRMHTSQVDDVMIIFLFPPRMLFHCRVTPALNLLVPICTPGWRKTLRVKCLAWELRYNAMSPTRARLFHPETNVLTIRTPHLPHYNIFPWDKISSTLGWWWPSIDFYFCFLPRFLLQLVVGSGLDQGVATLHVVETNPFKHLTHLSLKFLPGSDTEVKKYLANCLKKLQVKLI